MGTLKRIGDDGQFQIKWDVGYTHSLLIGRERFSVLPPEPELVSFYMPLTAEVFKRGEDGSLEKTGELLHGPDLLPYEETVADAMLWARGREEYESGIMYWSDLEEAIDTKVRSVFFNVEARDGQLWGVAECRIAGMLTTIETDTLMDYIAMQARCGWGENFANDPIMLDDRTELCVHLWNDKDWSIQTEQERFEPKQGLPDLCWSILPGEGKLICIKRGESGYYPSDWETGDPVRNRRIADYANQKRGITKLQEEAMLTGSMMGWGVPGADPKWLEEHMVQQKADTALDGQESLQLGGMQFGQSL